MAPDSSYTLAAVLATGDLQRLYSGLSLLVSAAVDGESCAALATYRSLDLMMDPGLGRLAANPDATRRAPSAMVIALPTLLRSLCALSRLAGRRVPHRAASTRRATSAWSRA